MITSLLNNFSQVDDAARRSNSPAGAGASSRESFNDLLADSSRRTQPRAESRAGNAASRRDRSSESPDVDASRVKAREDREAPESASVDRQDDPGLADHRPNDDAAPDATDGTHADGNDRADRQEKPDAKAEDEGNVKDGEPDASLVVSGLASGQSISNAQGAAASSQAETNTNASHAQQAQATSATAKQSIETIPVAVLDQDAAKTNTAASNKSAGTSTHANQAQAVTAVADTTGDKAGHDTNAQTSNQQQGGSQQPANASANTLGQSEANSAAARAYAASSSVDAADPATTARPAADASTLRLGANASGTLNASASAPIDDGDASSPNAARLARGLQSALNQRGGGVTLRLTPAEMGTIRIRLDISAGRVAAEFQPTTQAGQQMLNGQLNQLRASLESQGLTVDRLGVQPAASSSQSNAAQNQSNFNQSAQEQAGQQQSSTDGRSRGQYARPDQQGQDDQPGHPDSPPASFTDALGNLSDPSHLAATAAGV